MTEREHELELAEREARVGAAMSSLLDAFVVLRAVRDELGAIVDFVYEYVSDGACRVCGRRREEMVGHGVVELLPGHRVNGLFARCVRVVETGEGFELDGFVDEGPWGDRGRGVRSFDVRGVPVTGGIAVAFRDVTERRRLQSVLEVSEERYGRAIAALSEGIVIQDRDGAIISCNPAAERILGLTAGQMMGRTSVDPRWRAIREDGSPIPGEEHPAMVTLRSGLPVEGVIMGVHKPDGSLSWISIASMPFRAGSDGVGKNAVVTTFTDITARRSAEAKLRESEERFQAAVGSMQDAIAILSPVRDETGEIVDFRYDYINDALCELVGWTREQLLTRSGDEVHPGWTRSERFELYRQVMLTGVPFRSEDFHPEQAWGTEFARRALDTVVARAGEQLVISARDVTDRRRAEAQLRATQERFDAAVGSMLDAFTIISPVRDDEGGIVDFRWEYVNDSYCELVGFDRAQLVAHRLVELFPGFPASEPFAVYRRVSETGEPSLTVDVVSPAAWAGAREANRVLDTSIVAAGENVAVTARDVTERHRLEEQLRASEELFRTGVGSLLDGFTICSPVRDESSEIIDFRWEYANDAACARNGLTREQMLGQRISEVLPGYTSTDVFKLHRRVAKTGEPARVDEVSWQGEWSGGQQIDRAYDGSVVPLGPNIIVTGRDVTQARRNERELRLQAELLELAHDAVIVRDPVESRMTFWNREAEAIYGYSHREALGQVTHELLATVFPESRESVDDALARDGHWDGELRHTRKDGTVIVVSSRQALQRSEDGQPIAIIELNSDITDRKRAERDLADTRDLLERTQEISKTGGWEFDVATGRLTWTDEVYRIYGVERTADPTDVISAVAAYDAESAPVIEAAFKRLVEEGAPYDLELGLVRADGRRIWVHTSGRSMLEDGRVARVGGNIVDITGRREAEDEIRALNAELEQRVAARTEQLVRLNRELETFAYSVSHDLRAPLRAVSGFSQALLEDYAEKLGDDGRHDLERVRAAALRMGKLIDAVLELSRLSRRRLVRGPVDLTAVASEIVADLRTDDPDRRVEVEIQDGLLGDADPDLVRIVLANLLGNAFKFTAKTEDARIRFGAVKQGAVSVYFVADNGAGFDLAHAKRLLLPFHRLHRDNEFPGEGIGLATVMRAVRKHNGEIWAESAVNQGATFHSPGRRREPAGVGRDRRGRGPGVAAGGKRQQ